MSEIFRKVPTDTSEAMYELGVNYLCEDDTKALKWFRASAAQGNANGIDGVGGCYLFGMGVEKDASMAAQHYRAAAEKGNAKSMLKLGHAYKDGRGVEQDLVEAVSWYGKAESLGNKGAGVWIANVIAQSLTLPLKEYEKVQEAVRQAAKFAGAAARTAPSV